MFSMFSFSSPIAFLPPESSFIFLHFFLAGWVGRVWVFILRILSSIRGRPGLDWWGRGPSE